LSPGATVDGEGRLHLTLDAARAQVGPLAARVELPHAAVLRQGSLELLLDSRSGDFLLLRDRSTDRVLAGDLTPSPMIALQFKQASEARWLQVDPRGRQPLRKKVQYALGDWHLEPDGEPVAAAAAAEVSIADEQATIRHRLVAPGQGAAIVTQAIRPVDGGWSMVATVQVESGPADVVGVQYPIIPKVRIGGSGWDDVQLRMMSFGHRAVVPGHATVHDASYCGGW